MWWCLDSKRRWHRSKELEEPRKRFSLTASLFVHGEMSSIRPSVDLQGKWSTGECLSLTAIFTSEIVISPNPGDLLHLYTPHSSVVPKIAASCLSAVHTNPRLREFWRRHQPPCVGSGFYRNSLSFLWCYWKWQKGLFVPVVGEEPAYPPGKGGDFAYVSDWS